jgi:hypothetical protein
LCSHAQCQSRLSAVPPIIPQFSNAPPTSLCLPQIEPRNLFTLESPFDSSNSSSRFLDPIIRVHPRLTGTPMQVPLPPFDNLHRPTNALEVIHRKKFPSQQYKGVLAERGHTADLCYTNELLVRQITRQHVCHAKWTKSLPM